MSSESTPRAEVRTSASYRRVREIASGGMGRVDLVIRREGTFLRLYAVKRLLPHYQNDAEVRAMFLDEARIAGLLRHANVASVLDVGEDEDGPFLVMDYVEGVPLNAILARAHDDHAPIPVEVALRIVAHAAHGLAAAHDLTSPEGTPLELVHRDISPQNILVGFDGVARVTDFGIAKALGRQTRTSTGILKGKLGYMSPEQLRFRQPDRRSDIFALGVVLYETLAGDRLYPGASGEESARRILEEPPPDIADERDDVPPEVVGLIFKMLAKEPETRPRDARVVARALDAAIAELSAGGETLDVADYLADSFHEERARQQRDVAEAIEHASRPPSVSARDVPSLDDAITELDQRGPAPSRARRFWLAAAVTGVLLGVGALAWTWGPRSAAEPGAPSATRPPMGGAASKTAGGGVTTVSSEAAAAGAPPAGTPGGATPTPAAPSSDGEKQRSSRRRPRPERRGEGDLRLWGWQR